MSESNDRSRQSNEPERKRNPKDNQVAVKRDLREKMLDKTLADSFPTSDPPSSIPDPSAKDSLIASGGEKNLFVGLAPGTWVALSLNNDEVFATGATRDEAEQNARTKGHHNMRLLKVSPESDAHPKTSTEAA